jgi:hypothetical protein
MSIIKKILVTIIGSACVFSLIFTGSYMVQKFTKIGVKKINPALVALDFHPLIANAGVWDDMVPSTRCGFKNFQTTWKKSDFVKVDADWSTLDLMIQTSSSSHTYGGFTDVNGDGLNDYIFIDDYSLNRQDCLLLNTGKGWKVAFRCILQRSSNPNTEGFAYGDCAL